MTEQRPTTDSVNKLKYKDSSDLFADTPREHEPLASRMRPRNLDEYIGQDHIVGRGRLLRRAISADQLTSVIFYGPPGSGKTTLARVIANHTKSNFLTLNAVLTGVADIRESIHSAEIQRSLYGKKTILFVDEVHRWNKSQQDALLPWVENGTIILIGATTENPFFEVNKALVSRSRVFQLKPLTSEDLFRAAEQAILSKDRGYGNWKIEFEEGALEHLVETANGDARSLLNALEVAVETSPDEWSPEASEPKPPFGSTIYISREAAEESIQKKVVLYDRDGDYHYDIISAFIKSLRGRDPDAACYWLARMVKAGEDPHFIFRRMLISACEDTGLADPNAITVVESCARAFDRVGLPEGRYFLAHAALYLSTCPKSNSSMAFFDALASVEKEDTEVPNHLRDASRDAEGFGHGAGYLYPHAYRDHWVAQQYLPGQLAGKVFYTPTTQGYENLIRQDVLSRRELQISALLEQEKLEEPVSEWWDNPHFRGFEKTEENLTFSPNNSKKELALNRIEKSWQSRLDSNRAQILKQIRDTMENAAKLLRHHRSLVWNAEDALLIFDIMRKTPEGLTCGTCRNPSGIELLSQYSSTLEELDKPELALIEEGGNFFTEHRFLNTLKKFSEPVFDRIFFRDAAANISDIENACISIKEAESFFTGDSMFIFSQRIPSKSQHINKLLTEIFTSQDQIKILEKMEEAEKQFFTDKSNPMFQWNEEDFIRIFTEAGFTVEAMTSALKENRRISEEEIDRWFSEKSSYGNALCKVLDADEKLQVVRALKDLCRKQLFEWHTENAFITAKFK